ncbi:MAG: hypothetical protein GY716_22790 [bacterium]|nr:hypothetical protein [bacterium]
MTSEARRWAIVLGAGDGSRLQSLVRQSGEPVPKQYCTLDGRASLLDMALGRAERVVTPSEVLTIVAEKHRTWWTRDLVQLPPRNVIVQPENRGTAAGVLLPLLEVQRRDPRGRVVLLPSDHWVEREDVLADAIDSAFESLQHDPERILLVGISPGGPEPGYGWIVPGAARNLPGGAFLHTVDAFVEKPDAATADRLMHQGGLWNSFVIVATAPALIRLYARRLPQLLALMTVALDKRSGLGLTDLYATLDNRDFSRELMQGSEEFLGVVNVPPCGWTDLGTPLRVADCVRRSALRPAEPSGVTDSTDRVNLAALLGTTEGRTEVRVEPGGVTESPTC